MQTITEALAEIATIDKRLPKKAEQMANYVARVDALRDPLERSGGSAKFIGQERQSFADLLSRKVELRRAIAKANAETTVVIDGQERSVADWLVWKRECYKPHLDMLRALLTNAQQARAHATQHGVALVKVGDATKPEDVIVNVDEQKLLVDIETLEETYGRLDGLLSLKNATTQV